MKGIKKILIILLIITMLPLTVYAEPEIIKTDSFEFELSETPITCLSGGSAWLPYKYIRKDGRIMFIEMVLTPEKPIQMYNVQDNTCKNVITQDKLDIQNTEKFKYQATIKSNNDIVITEEHYYEHLEKYVKTTDTTIQQNKKYYKRVVIESTGEFQYFDEVENATDEELSNLYEIITITTPLKAEIDPNVTYYKYFDEEETKLEIVKVENPTVEEIDNYMVYIDVEGTKTIKEVKKYTNSGFAEVVRKLNTENFGVIKQGESNEFLFFIRRLENYPTQPEGTPTPVGGMTDDIYNVHGNMLYTSINTEKYTALSNKAALINTGNNKLNLFDANLKLVKTFDDTELELVYYQTGTKYDTAYLVGVEQKIYQLKITQTGEIADSTNPNNPANPDTSDKIIISIIIAVLSIFGFKKIIKKVRQSF